VTIIEVFADVACPFTHLGLRRLVERRAAAGRDDVRLMVRAWPLEIVNGHPLDPHLIEEEVADIRAQVAPDLFAGFREDAFPHSSIPAMALTEAGYRADPATGERIALRLRDLLFEEGVDVADRAVLATIAAEHGVDAPFDDPEPVLADHAEGMTRGVIGSPHFFIGDGGSFFCPSLEVSRDAEGALHVAVDAAGLDAFLTTCFG
jgi:predicted DsbA family dithiol-disulfide isomerase